LARIGDALLERRTLAAADRPRVGGHARTIRHASVYSSLDGPKILPEALAGESTRVLLVGGKGGVGKTTVAATMAVRLACADASRRVLLVSTDPAHSVGDVLGASIGDAPAPVPGAPGNVRAREIDAAALLAARRLDVQQAVDEILAAAGASAGGGIDDLMRLAPPGIDELLAIVEVARLVDGHSADGPHIIVVDLAPTGHALRLLQMPAAAHEWVRVLLRMLLKYRAMVRPGRLAAELIELSQSIGRLQRILRDPRQTRLVAVTRPAGVPLCETERLLRALKRLRIAAPVVVVNAVTLAPESCRRCRAVASAERRMRSRIVGIAGKRPAVVVVAGPLAAPPPRGAKELERWGAEWTKI